MHDQVIYLGIAVMLLSACLFGYLQYLFRRGKISVTKRNLVPMAFFYLTGLTVPYLDHQLDKKDWRDLEFSGRVELVEVTKQHALVMFTIVSEDMSRQEVVDRFGKMRECKKGNWVRKPKGSESVLLIAGK